MLVYPNRAPPNETSSRGLSRVKAWSPMGVPPNLVGSMNPSITDSTRLSMNPVQSHRG